MTIAAEAEEVGLESEEATKVVEEDAEANPEDEAVPEGEGIPDDGIERRWNPEDGQPYTYEAYLAAFSEEHGEDETKAAWELLTIVGQEGEMLDDGEERRLDPTSGSMMSFAEYSEAYKGEFNEEEINTAWEGLLTERRMNPSDNQWYTFEELQEAYKDQAAEDEVNSYWEQSYTWEQFAEMNMQPAQEGAEEEMGGEADETAEAEEWNEEEGAPQEDGEAAGEEEEEGTGDAEEPDSKKQKLE